MFFRQMKSLIKLSFLELWRRHEIFAFLVLALALMVPLASANPFGAEGASRYLDEVALLMIWAFSFFLAIGAGARAFPSEFDSRTILPLLARPISPWRLLLGKYLGATAAAASALAFFYALYASSVALRGGAVLTAAAGAAVTSVSRSIGTAASNAVTGKGKKQTGKDIAGKAITNATSSALRTLTRSILGSLIK